MSARWMVLVVLVAASAGAEERGFVQSPEVIEERPTHLRTFIGGFVSGGFVTRSYAPIVVAGPVGFAADLGAQFDRQHSLSFQFRASTWGQMSHFHAGAGFEWTFGFFSLGVGAGAAALLSLIPTSIGGLLPAVSLPLTLGFSPREHRVANAWRSFRVNVEFALLVAPAPLGVGGSIGISLGQLTR